LSVFSVCVLSYIITYPHFTLTAVTDNSEIIPRLADNKGPPTTDILFGEMEDSGPKLIAVTRNIKHHPFKHSSEVKVGHT